MQSVTAQRLLDTREQVGFNFQELSVPPLPPNSSHVWKFQGTPGVKMNLTPKAGGVGTASGVSVTIRDGSNNVLAITNMDNYINRVGITAELKNNKVHSVEFKNLSAQETINANVFSFQRTTAAQGGVLGRETQTNVPALSPHSTVLWTFNGTAGEQVNPTVWKRDFDLQVKRFSVSILDPSGKQIFADTTKGAVSGVSVFEPDQSGYPFPVGNLITLPTSGTYTLIVHNLDNANVELGALQVKLSVLKGFGNFNREGFEMPEMNTYQWGSWSLPVKTGEMVRISRNITEQGVSQRDDRWYSDGTEIVVKNEKGETVAKTEDLFYPEPLTFTAPKDATYTILLHNKSPYTTIAGNYAFGVPVETYLGVLPSTPVKTPAFKFGQSAVWKLDGTGGRFDIVSQGTNRENYTYTSSYVDYELVSKSGEKVKNGVWKPIPEYPFNPVQLVELNLKEESVGYLRIINNTISVVDAEKYILRKVPILEMGALGEGNKTIPQLNVMQRAVWTFQGEAGEMFNPSLLNSESDWVRYNWYGAYEIKLTDSSGEEIFEPADSDGVRTFSNIYQYGQYFFLPKTDTYTLSIRNVSPTIKLQGPEILGPTWLKGGTAPLNGSLNTPTMVGTQATQWDYTVTESGNFSATVSIPAGTVGAENSVFTVMLVDENGAFVTGNFGAYGESPSGINAGLMPGKYKLVI